MISRATDLSVACEELLAEMENLLVAKYTTPRTTVRECVAHFGAPTVPQASAVTCAVTCLLYTSISSDGTNVWIANSGDGTVSQYNIADGANVNTITVGADPTGVYSDGQFVFVANTGDGTVTVLNADDGSYADGTGGSPIQVGNDPTGITAKMCIRDRSYRLRTLLGGRG